MAGLTYLLHGIIAYRLLQPPRNNLGMMALAVLAILMAANVVYNLVLARTRSPRLLYIGVIWFLPPLLVLQILLVCTDSVGAILNFLYVIWVIGYDLPTMRALWKMNDPSSHPGAGLIIVEQLRRRTSARPANACRSAASASVA